MVTRVKTCQKNEENHGYDKGTCTQTQENGCYKGAAQSQTSPESEANDTLKLANDMFAQMSTPFGNVNEKCKKK